MSCFEFDALYEDVGPHHRHRRILQSFRVDYRVTGVPTANNIYSEIKKIIYQACHMVTMDFDDMLRVAIQTDARDPIVVHNYFRRQNTPGFQREVRNFSQQVYKVCQSTRCFTIGHNISVLIDRIAPRSSGSSCQVSYYSEKDIINQFPLEKQKCPSEKDPAFIYLPKKSGLFKVKRYTFASEQNCLFQCLFLELARIRIETIKDTSCLIAHEFNTRKYFPFGYCRKKAAKFKRTLYQRWKNGEQPLAGVDESLRLASVKFAHSIDCQHLLDKSLDIKDFRYITNRLTRFKARFALFDSGLNILTSTDNLNDKLVMLMVENDHYHIIDHIQFQTHKMCKFCLHLHEKMREHKCLKICHICKTSACLAQPMSRENITCDQCKMLFRNERCKLSHTKTICNRRKSKCRYCKEQYFNNSENNGYGHICTKFHCRVCGAVDDCLDHNCSLTGARQSERIAIYNQTTRIEKNQPINFDLECEEQLIEANYQKQPLPPTSGSKAIFIYYDIETIKIKPEETSCLTSVDKKTNILIPVLICAQSECHECVNDQKINCHCGRIDLTFHSTKDIECVNEFIDKLLAYTKSYENTQFFLIAHNGGRFDHHFLLKAIASNASTPELFIRRGNSVIGVKIQNMTILDSYRFIPLSLRAMPKAIGLDIELAKDYFPHKITSIETLEHGLPQIPPKDDFGYNGMSVKDKEDFDSWYQQQTPGFYDMKKIMIKYCKKDVEVLRFCCRKFIGNWYHRFGYNPFESYTLPSTVVQSMIKATPLAALVPLTPFHGYNRGKCYSLVAAAFLDVQEVIFSRKYNRAITIEREVKISPKFHADGVLRLEDGRVSKVIEFLGCYFHLCDLCGFNTSRENFVTTKTIVDENGEKKTINRRMTKEDDVQVRLAKKRFCQKQGFEYIEFWEHEIDSLPEEYSTLFTKKYEQRKKESKITPITHRDALFGGRTEAFSLYYECKDDEIIEYHDINGLYPFILMEGRFPLMDPIFISPQEIKLPIDQYIRYLHQGPIRFAGLVKCRVLPPQGLLLPVLPYRTQGKLFFTLCKTCTDSFSSECMHEEFEREFDVTVTSFELELALDYGYRVTSVDIIEAYEMCAGPNDPGLPNPHREFIGKAMAMKKYAEEKNNPAGRFLAKLAGNTYWGALGKNPDNISTTFFGEVDQFYDFIDSSSVLVKDVYSIGNHLRVDYRTMSEMIVTPKRTSLITAIFVTSQARITLYKYLRLIGARRVLYCDTDSVIWVRSRGEEIPYELSSNCGDMSDEIGKECPTGYIHKFVSLGPKSYCYEIRDRVSKKLLKTSMRMKGISFNGLNKGTSLTFDEMYQLLQGEMSNITLQQRKFQVNSKFSTLHEEVFEKNVRLTMNKRIINSDYSTFPFGFKMDENETLERKLTHTNACKRARIENFNTL